MAIPPRLEDTIEELIRAVHQAHDEMRRIDALMDKIARDEMARVRAPLEVPYRGLQDLIDQIAKKYAPPAPGA